MSSQKPFKTFSQQIKILNKDEKLNIRNEISKGKLHEYLKEYNMQKVIDGYNDPFLDDPNNRSNSFYRNSANSDMILAFFDFEFDLSNLLIKTILRIETRINTSVCYEILNKMSTFGKVSLYQLDLTEFQTIFNLTSNFFIPNKNNNSQAIFNDLKEKSIKTIKEYSFKDPNSLSFKATSGNLTQIYKLALYKTSISWTFGTTNLFFKRLKKRIQRKIIKNYFSDLEKISIGAFIVSIEIIYHLRNIISHNDVIYNVDFYKSIYARYSNIMRPNKLKKILQDAISYFKLPVNKNSIKLYDVILIIDKIMPESKLKKEFIEKINNLKDNIDRDGFQYIVSQMNFII